MESKISDLLIMLVGLPLPSWLQFMLLLLFVFREQHLHITIALDSKN